MQAFARAVALGLIVAPFAIFAAPPTVDEVGDVDSFGRGVIYLGFAQSEPVQLRTSCPSPLPTGRCVILNAQPAPTTFDEDKLATMLLPGKSTNSLICFALTPLVSFQFHNLTGVSQPVARFDARAVVTIENDVLNDPSLINPLTGLPFNGQFTVQLPTHSQSRSIAAGERAVTTDNLSRNCIGGLVSKRSLTEIFGLTPSQADSFFTKPIALTFDAAGTVQIVDNASYGYGIRLYGDARK